VQGGPDYVTDVPYVRAFEPDLSPLRLRLVAALNGLAPPPAADFDYCELGSAHGDTTATLAAAYPRARFVGVDINSDHIASSKKLAARGDLANIRFLLDDFEDLVRADIPAFDFITAHGVLSWISPKKRAALVAFAAAKLKPGGLLLVTYNALPGWAPVEPLRQLIAGRAALVEGDSLARAKEGVSFARRMSELGAEYFSANPATREMLEKMAKLGLAYVAHEYLHAHWCPMYFAQVASEMAAGGLHFVGQLPLYLNYRDLAVPERLAPVFAGVADRVTFESLKDFALNEYFRRDVFVKGHPPRTETATRAYLDGTAFGRSLGGEPIPHDLVFPHHTLHFAGPLFDALTPVLEEGATTVDALVKRPELRAFEPPRIRDAVMRLALGEALVPHLASTTRATAPRDARYSITLPYNRGALGDGLTLDAPLALASEVAGTGVELSSMEAAALYVMTEVAPGDRDAWIRDRCSRPTFRLVVRGHAVEDLEDRVRTVTQEVERFCERRLPGLVEVGVVERA
jgi:SAM-dependent methyltransferase